MNELRSCLRRPFAALLLVALVFAAGLPCRADSEVWTFFRSDVPLYLAVVQQLETHLKRRFVSCPIEKTSSSFIDSHAPKLVIALGEAGLKRALTMTWDVPILALFVDGKTDDPRVVDVDIPQPHRRQLELLKKLHPGLKTIWYPYAGEAFGPPAILEKAAERAGLKLVVTRLQDPRMLPEALRVLDNPEAATILPPDPGLMNDAITRPVMLAAFRSQTAIVGFSEALVKKGAAFAFVLTPARLAAYLDGIVAELDERRSVPAFDEWDLILNATILEKLQLSPSAEIRDAAVKVF